MIKTLNPIHIEFVLFGDFSYSAYIVSHYKKLPVHPQGLITSKNKLDCQDTTYYK
jgi:hypothetical protein